MSALSDAVNEARELREEFLAIDEDPNESDQSRIAAARDLAAAVEGIIQAWGES